MASAIMKVLSADAIHSASDAGHNTAKADYYNLALRVRSPEEPRKINSTDVQTTQKKHALFVREEKLWIRGNF